MFFDFFYVSKISNLIKERVVETTIWEKSLKKYKEKTRLSFVFLKMQNRTREFSDVRWDRIRFLVI